MGVLFSLSDLSLDDLIAAAQAQPVDDTAAMAAVLGRFEADIAFIANTTADDWNLRQDAAQGARLGLVKAVRNHTPGTRGFRSYASRYMRTEAVRTVRSMTSEEVTTDPFILLEPAPELRPGVIQHHEAAVEESEPFEFADLIRVLAPSQQSVVQSRYIGGHAVANIAASLGISTSAASQRLATIHRMLRPIVLGEVAA